MSFYQSFLFYHDIYCLARYEKRRHQASLDVFTGFAPHLMQLRWGVQKGDIKLRLMSPIINLIQVLLSRMYYSFACIPH